MPLGASDYVTTYMLVTRIYLLSIVGQIVTDFIVNYLNIKDIVRCFSDDIMDNAANMRMDADK